MILQPTSGRWLRASSGQEVHYTCPQTAREVLPVHTALVMYASDLRATPSLVEACQAWLLPRITNTSSPSGLLHYGLGPTEVVLLALKVYEDISLDPEVREELVGYLKVIVAGGCECRLCEGRKQRSDATKTELRLCKYTGVSETVRNLTGLYTPLKDADSLSLPWWAYQVRQALSVAEAEVSHQRRLERRTKEKIQEFYKSKGVR